MIEVNFKQPMSRGAGWTRAALQVNPYGYVGRNSPSNKFPDEVSYNASLLAACQAENIDIIAVTDHWNVDSAQQLIADAESAGIVALPGFEAVSKEGVHLLVIFEKGTKSGVINAAIGVCGVEPGCVNGTTGEPFHEIVEQMTGRGALVIPAHANVASGGMLTKRAGNPLVDMVRHVDIHAIAITPSEPDGVDQASIFKGCKPYDRVHPISMIYADDICEPSALATVGAATWFKVSALNLNSIKLAVRTPATRVSTVDPTSAPKALIREISWAGGFLDGVKLLFADDLTAIIGGRGTGKSTVIESIRYVLDLEPLGENAKRDHKLVVDNVLRSATTVSLVIDAVTPKVSRYTVTRTVHNPPVVLDASGTATNLKPIDVIGVVEVFGQHELAELASDKTAVARMIERFASASSQGAGSEDLRRRLAENRNALHIADEELDDIDAQLADLPRLNDQLRHFEETDLATKLEEQKRLAEDESVIAEGRSRIVAAKTLIDKIKVPSLIARLQTDIPAVPESPQAQTLGRVVEVTRALSTAIVSSISTLDTALDTAQRELSDIHDEWNSNTEVQRATYIEVSGTLRGQGYDPDAYLSTTRAISVLNSLEIKRADTEVHIEDLKGERRTMLVELGALEDEELTKFKDAIRQANKATNGVVVCRPISSPVRDDIKSVINMHLTGTRNIIIAAVDRPDFSPRVFVEAARESDARLEEYGIKGAQLKNLRAAGEPLLRELEEMSVPAAADVLLKVESKSSGSVLRKLDELSKGQRATALLLLLLGASSAPLVIDQPEDDLDNRFVYDGVVANLRGLKGVRQIIASTHNANVPVLGDAELIVTMVGDGTNGWPEEGRVGSMDEALVRARAEDLLEGGTVAFDARQHLYGF